MRTKEILERCDNPACGYEEILAGKGEVASGFHFGKGQWSLGGGGPIPAFYAHEEKCIVPAFRAVMDRAGR